MKTPPRTPQTIYRWTTVVWSIGVVSHIIIRVSLWSALPQTDEVYANQVGFQLLAFALGAGPCWIGSLIAILLIEFALFGRAR